VATATPMGCIGKKGKRFFQNQRIEKRALLLRSQTRGRRRNTKREVGKLFLVRRQEATGFEKEAQRGTYREMSGPHNKEKSTAKDSFGKGGREGGTSPDASPYDDEG